MHPLFNISSVSLLAGLLFLLQASFNHAWGSSKPPASPQEPQTFILPFYLKSKPLSEKKLVFRKALSFFPFLKKIPEYIASSGNIRGWLLTKESLFSFSELLWDKFPEMCAPDFMNWQLWCSTGTWNHGNGIPVLRDFWKMPFFGPILSAMLPLILKLYRFALW